MGIGSRQGCRSNHADRASQEGHGDHGRAKQDRKGEGKAREGTAKQQAVRQVEQVVQGKEAGKDRQQR